MQVSIRKACLPLEEDDDDAAAAASSHEQGEEGRCERWGGSGGGSRERVVLQEETPGQADAQAGTSICAAEDTPEGDMEYPELLLGCEASAFLRLCECVRTSRACRDLRAGLESVWMPKENDVIARACPRTCSYAGTDQSSALHFCVRTWTCTAQDARRCSCRAQMCVGCLTAWVVECAKRWRQPTCPTCRTSFCLLDLQPVTTESA